MVQPIDYMAMMPQVDLAERFGSGLKLGAMMGEAQQAQDARKAKEQYALDLQQAMQNPTADTFAALTAKYPGQREAFKQSWDMLDKSAKDAQFSAGVQAYSAIASGSPDIAKSIIDQHIDASENSGEDASELRKIKAALDVDPRQVQGHLGLMLSSIDPEKWGAVAKEFRESQKAPVELSEAQSKAAKAAVDAKFAESAAVMDLEKKGWDISKIQSDIDISRQNTRIAAINSDLAREQNQLKREQLQQKLQDAQTKRDEAVRTKSADVESARFNIDNMLNTTDRILSNKSLNDVIGSLEGRMPEASSMLDDEESDAIALINTLGSQAFLSQLPNIKGMGQLSNAEGDKLQSALQNLGRGQSEKQFKTNLSEVQRLLMKARVNVSNRYGVPDVVPDRPAVETQPEVPQTDVPLPNTSGFKVLGVER